MLDAMQSTAGASEPPAVRSVQRSVRSDVRALLAIALKEWIIFRRYPSWIIGFLIWPVLYPYGFIFAARALGGPHGLAISAFRQHTGTSDYLSFIVVGTTMYMWLNYTLWDVGLHLRNEQLRGTLESNWLCPIPRIAIMLGSSLTKLATALVTLALMVGEFRLILGVNIVRGNPLLVILIVLLVSASIYGIGLAFGSLVLRFREANALVFLVRGLFMVCCGITYPLQVLPPWMQAMAAALPLTYAIHAIRAVTLAGATFTRVEPDLAALGICALVWPALGFAAFAITERQARRTGALGQY
jgi:ABC-2 type transport system permease protein